MKKYKIVCFQAFLLFTFCFAAKKDFAQAGFDSLIAAKNFALNVSHVPTGNFSAGYYYLKVIGDSVSANLPYVFMSNGSGNSNRANYTHDESGIIVNTRDFSYSAVHAKKGSYVITITLKSDKVTQSFLLRVNSKGFANLTVDSYERSSVSFYGPIVSN